MDDREVVGDDCNTNVSEGVSAIHRSLVDQGFWQDVLVPNSSGWIRQSNKG